MHENVHTMKQLPTECSQDHENYWVNLHKGKQNVGSGVHGVQATDEKNLQENLRWNFYYLLYVYV